MMPLVKNLTQLVICAFVIFGLSNCKGDQTNNTSTVAPESNAADLVGEWTIIKAFKEDSPSKMLEKGLFTFTANNEFSTNILGDAAKYPYTFSRSRIKVDNKSRTSYDVTVLTPDTLVMKTKLRNFDFKFITVKVK